jgi:hypothetical protein
MEFRMYLLIFQTPVVDKVGSMRIHRQDGEKCRVDGERNQMPWTYRILLSEMISEVVAR